MEKMTRIAFLLFILATWTGLANSARPYLQLSDRGTEENSPSIQPSDQDTDDKTPSSQPSDQDTDDQTTPSSDVYCIKASSLLYDCVPYLSEGSQATSLGLSCCYALESVATNDPGCLCPSFELFAAEGYSLNVTKVKTLSSACRFRANLLDNCRVYRADDIDSPAMSPLIRGGSDPMFKGPTQSPAPAPRSGAYSISAKVALTFLNMLGAASLLL